MNKYILTFVVSLLVGFGLGFLIPHGATSGQVGGLYRTIPTQFVYGFTAGQTNQFAVDSAGNATTTANLTAATYKTNTVGSSSSTPAVLGSAASGHFIVAAAATTASASTTAVTANSNIDLSLEQTTPIAGTTCNTTVNASSTYAIVTKAAGNGFTMSVASAPITNPFCYSYRITN